MAEKILNTRIALKYDLLSNWTTSTLILKKGEVGIAEIPSATAGSGLTPPAIGIKVGDGENLYKDLPWIQAVAGDVSAWAKAAVKPSYTATEIAAEVTTGDGKTVESRIAALEDADAASDVYRVLKDTSAEKWYLQKKAGNADDSAFETVSTINLVDILDAKQDNLTFEGTYNASTNKVATESTVNDAITAITDTLTGTPAASKTVTAFDQVDGKVTATFEDITVTLSQVTDAGIAASHDVASSIVVNSLGDLETEEEQLPTVEAVVEYIDKKTSGLTGAMHFKGTVSIIPPDIGAYESGDVVLLENTSKEYIYDGTSWALFGDEGSYALKDTTISAGNGLTGGGSLEQNRTISHAVPNEGAAQDVNAGSNTFVSAMYFDEFGHVTQVETDEPITYTFAEGNVNGAFSVTMNNSDGDPNQTVSIHGLGNAAYKALAASGVADGDTGLVTADEVYDHVNGIVTNLTGSAAATAADGNEYSVLTGVTEANGVISKTSEVKLAAIAKTGNVNDLIQTSGDVLVLNCGDSFN